MKKWLPAAVLLLMLTACGAQETPAQEQPVEEPPAAAEVQPEQEAEQPAVEEEAVTEEADPAEEEAPAEEPAGDSLFAQAAALIDSNVEDLYDTIGYPVDVMYADSCLGEGEDGELYYDCFTVYTYRDPEDVETIYDVMEN